MPLEVTPVPFAGQQLPYTPKFVRPEIEGAPGSGVSAVGVGAGMGMGGGPATAAASAIIPPSPGGVAGPHRAIPALPEVGYTAPSIAPNSFGGEYRAAPSSYGGPLPPAGVGINGSCPVHQQPSAYGGGGWGGSMYGAPRPSHIHHIPGPALSAIQSDSYANSLPAPRRGPAPSLLMTENVITPRGTHHHHHHHTHDDDDKASDVSYYARPKHGRTRSGSVTSSRSDASSPRERDREGGHHRSSSVQYRERKASPRLQPVGNQHEHSPSSPSPLSLAGGMGMKSPLSPQRPEMSRQKSGNGNGEEGKRDRKVSTLAPTDDGRREKKTSLEKEVEEGHGGDAGVQHHHHHHHHHYDNSREEVDEKHHRHQHRDDHSSHHSKDDSHSEPRQRRHTTHHRHHSHSHSHAHPHTPVQPPPSVVPPPSISYSTRRRAHSMQFDPRPLEEPTGMYQAPPSMLYGGQPQGYDDGASIAGSAMTFMDGPVGGRVSQYGLPKYSHQPKPDYRRFMVQRGNADVFLD